MSQSGCWAWRTRLPSDRELTDAWLTERIRKIHEASKGRYGSPRCTRSAAHSRTRVASGPLSRSIASRAMLASAASTGRSAIQDTRRRGSSHGAGTSVFAHRLISATSTGTSVSAPASLVPGLVPAWYHQRMAMNLRLTEREADALRRKATEEGRSMQEVAKAAIAEYVSDRPARLRAAIERVRTEDAELLERLSR